MRPFVAPLAQLTDQAPLGKAQGLAEHVVPLLPHDFEQRSTIEMRRIIVAPRQLIAPGAGDVRHPIFAILILQLALDEGLQPLAQQVERFADPFLVGDGHAFLLVRSEWRGVRDEQ